MKLVFMIGNAAVGKMTVGQALAKITGLRLFHNHMTIEPVLEIFGQYQPQVIERLRTAAGCGRPQKTVKNRARHL